jgi:hypothetical protein
VHDSTGCVSASPLSQQAAGASCCGAMDTADAEPTTVNTTIKIIEKMALALRGGMDSRMA